MRGKSSSVWALWLLGGGLVAWLVVAVLMGTVADPDRGFEEFGDNMEREGHRRILAWDVWVEHHGEPPGHARWLAERGDLVPPGSPNAAAEMALNDLGDAPRDSRRSRAFEEVLEIRDAVAEGGHDELAAAYAQWREEQGEAFADADPRGALERYAEQLAAADDPDAAEHLAAIEELRAVA
ncbi:hypothetical protein [Nocardioides solisilvae]|uniref:hypothetical protein n=1 Tax=Nocardioides solisilvae TaxID=1542435 RepID=UPI0013A5A909|nr:hypothetical protein [Nocardioides solisilvae]